MDSHKNFDLLLALAKNNYSELSDLQPGLEFRDLSDIQLHEIYLTAVKANPRAIDFVPDFRRDEEILIAFILHIENKDDLNRIFDQYFNQKNATYKILVAFVRRDIRLLLDLEKNWEHVSTQFNLTEQQTYPTLCLDVLKDNWRAMRFYPSLIEDNAVMKAIQNCKTDVSQDWRDIIYVPEYLLEDKFFQASILKAQQAIMSGELEIAPFFSQKILTEKCCLAAVARDVYNFSNIPNILRTKNVCYEAVKASVYQLVNLVKPENRLGLTPDEYKNLCLEAIEIHGPQALAYIQHTMRTYNLCLAALNKGVEALQYLGTASEREGLLQDEYKDLCLKAIKLYGAKALQYIPREMRTHHLYVEALNNNIDVLQFLKENYDESGLTSSDYNDFWKLASDKYGKEAVLKFIPPEMRTKSLWISAVTANVSELNDLKTSFDKTGLSADDYKDIYLAAVKEHGRSALYRIAPERWTYDLCVAAVNKNIDALDEITRNQKQIPLKLDEYTAIFAVAKKKYGIEAVFPHFPTEMRTYAICLKVIKKDEYALKLLEKPEDRGGLKPGEYNKLCLEAIELYGYRVLDYIPPEMRTYDICLAAVKKDKYALNSLLKPKDREGLKPGEYNKLCLEAIERHGFSVLYVIPPELRSYEVCLAAVDKDKYALSIIEKPRERIALTADQYANVFAAAKNKYGIGATFRHLSTETRTYAVCLEAVTKDEYVLRLLEKPEDRQGLKPNEYNTLCLEALKLHGLSVFKYIPENMWTYDLCLAAVTKDVKWLSELQLNRDQTTLTPDQYIMIYLEANKIHGSSALRYFPPEMRTFDIFLDAVKKDVGALDYLKDPEEREEFKPNAYFNICLAAIETHGSLALSHIDPNILTYDLLLAAINKDVGALPHISYQRLQNKLTENEYLTLSKAANDKYSIKETFQYLPPELKTYDVCLAAANDNVDVLTYLKTPNDRKKLTSKEYSDLCLVVIKKRYGGIIHPFPTDDVLINFLARYEAITEFNNYKIADIGTFFSSNISVISEIYPLLGKYTFLLMEKMLITSADNLNRFLSELRLRGQYAASCSKNITRLFDNVDYKNASKKASQFKLYLFLSNEEKKEINILLDDNKTNIETIPNVMRELVVKRFYDYLKLPYNNKDKNVMDTLSNEQLADLNGVFEDLKKEPNLEKSKIFFSLLKMHLAGIPFQDLHQPDEMSKKGNEHMVKMAAHNKKLRAGLADGGIDVSKAFSYKKQIPLTFDEHQKQKILKILNSIYKKIKDSVADKNPNAINKNIKNLISQIEKGKDSKDNKLLKMLSESNLSLLKKIANSVLPDSKPEYLALTKLATKPEVLTNYTPRKFHIEMWDKSKIETFFLGDYLSCCLATTGSMRTEYAPRVFDDAFLMPVIIDETTKRPVCGAWLFFGETTKPPANDKTIDLVANFFEINAGIAENKALMNFLMVNLLNYIGQFSQSIKAAEFIMRPLTYGMIPDFHTLGTFTATNNRTVEKVGGYFCNEKYYLNAVGTGNFYLFDQTKFGKQMQKLIAAEPNVSEYASSITLGFASKPTRAPEAEHHPARKPSDLTHH